VLVNRARQTFAGLFHYLKSLFIWLNFAGKL
jgi:hypothetical protein